MVFFAKNQDHTAGVQVPKQSSAIAATCPPVLTCAFLPPDFRFQAMVVLARPMSYEPLLIRQLYCLQKLYFLPLYV